MTTNSPKATKKRRQALEQASGQSAREAAKSAPDETIEDSQFSGITCSLNQLSYDLPPNQVDIAESVAELKLSSSVFPVDADGVIEFAVEPVGQNLCLSLFDSYFTFKTRIIYSDGTKLEPGHKVTTIPFLQNTMFRKIVCFVNGQQISSPTSANHMYESFISVLGQVSEESKKYLLAPALFLIDTELPASSIENWEMLGRLNFFFATAD